MLIPPAYNYCTRHQFIIIIIILLIVVVAAAVDRRRHRNDRCIDVVVGEDELK